MEVSRITLFTTKNYHFPNKKKKEKHLLSLFFYTFAPIIIYWKLFILFINFNY